MLTLVGLAAAIPSAWSGPLLGFTFALSLVLLGVAVSVKRPLEISRFRALGVVVLSLKSVALGAVTRAFLLAPTASCLGSRVGVLLIDNSTRLAILIFLVLLFLCIRAQLYSEITSQISARFTLDCLPGRHMAVDADLHAGRIAVDQARAKREELGLHAKAYEALDGLGELLRLDIWLTLIVIFGCLLVGALRLTFWSLPGTWSELVLVALGNSVLLGGHSFITATALGVMGSRVMDRTGFDCYDTLLPRREEVLATTAGATAEIIALAGLGLPPGTSLGLQMILRKKSQGREEVERLNSAPEESRSLAHSAKREKPKPVTVELGQGLLELLSLHRRPELQEEASRIREGLKRELGFPLPGVEFRDSQEILEAFYAIKIEGRLVAYAEIKLGRLLALATEQTVEKLPGYKVTEPVFGMLASWIRPDQIPLAEALGCPIFEPRKILLSHLAEVLRRNAHHLFSRSQVFALIGELSCPSQRIEATIEADTWREILREVVAEGCPVRRFEELVGDLGPQLKRGPKALVPMAREILVQDFCSQLVTPEGKLYVVTLAEELETKLLKGGMSRESLWEERLVRVLELHFDTLIEEGLRPVLLVPTKLRGYLSELTKGLHRDRLVLSHREVRGVTIKSLGTVPAPCG